MQERAIECPACGWIGWVSQLEVLEDQGDAFACPDCGAFGDDDDFFPDTDAFDDFD